MVLLSGGLDSAVLLADEASRGVVYPAYVSAGLAWERFELRVVEAFLAHMRGHAPAPSAIGEGSAAPDRVRVLARLSVDMTDVYAANHWAVAGRPPAYHTPDEDVYLPGRNVVLLGKAGVYAAVVGAARLVIGTLDHNPFPDATSQFRVAMAAALSLGLARTIDIDAPYAHLSKAEVIRRGAALGVPLAMTLSCMKPVDGPGPAGPPASLPRHCGVCSKCRERHDAFVEAEVSDPTDYADRQHVV